MKTPEIVKLRARVYVGKIIFFTAVAFIAAFSIATPLILGLAFGAEVAMVTVSVGVLAAFVITLVASPYLEDLPEDIALLEYYESQQ